MSKPARTYAIYEQVTYYVKARSPEAALRTFRAVIGYLDVKVAGVSLRPLMRGCEVSESDIEDAGDGDVVVP